MAYSGAYGQSRRPPEPANEEEAAAPYAGANEGRRSPARPPGQNGGGRSPFDLNGLFKRIEAAGMETDDLLMALILFLMYRESGDKDLLIMLAAMLLT